MNEGPAPNRFTAEWGPWTQKMIPPQHRDEAHGMLWGWGVPSSTRPGPAEFRVGDDWSRSLRQERAVLWR